MMSPLSLLQSQAAQKGPDARRRPRAAREAYFPYVERAAEGANEADGPFSAACHKRESFVTAHVVDDLEHPRVEPRILDAELLAQTAVVHQVVAGFLATAFLGERDLRVVKESADG